MTSGKLTLRDRLLFVCERPEGFDSLYQFCEDIQEDRDPDPEFLKQLAEAFKLVLREKSLREGMSLFEKEMGLHGKAGRTISANEMDARIVAGLEYRDLLAKGKSESFAADDVATRYKKSPNTIRGYAKKYPKEIAEYESMIKTWETKYKNRNTKLK